MSGKKFNGLRKNLWREFLLGWRLMWQYIARGRKWTLGLTVFLMAVAFVNLVFVSSLLSGVNVSIENQVKNIMVGEVYVSPVKSTENIKQANNIVNDIRKIDHVKSADAVLSVYGEISSGDNTVQTTVKIIDPKTFTSTININDYKLEGDFLSGDDEIFVGEQILATGENKQLAESLEGTKIGDSVKLKINGKEISTKIGGSFRTKYMYADREIYMTRNAWKNIIAEVENDKVKNVGLSGLQFTPANIFPDADAANLIVVRTEDGKDSAVKSKIEQMQIDGGKVRGWKDSAGYTNNISDSFLMIDAVMLVVGIFIAAVTIFIVIYVDVINKRRQIGIQRAIGIKPRIIVFSYILLSVFYAICGVLLGLVVFFGVLMVYFDAHPFSLPIADVTLHISIDQLILRIYIVLLVAIISGILPSIMASRMKILEAILGRG